MSDALYPIRSFDELPDAASIGFGELVAINLSTTTNPLTHGLHRYPAKFIPQIPRWAIRQFSRPGDLILDPFAGSATSIVEALAAGRRGIGIDLDPLACLIGRAKVADLDHRRLRGLALAVLQRSTLRRTPTVVPMVGVKNFEHWFSPAAWSDLQSIKSAIDAIAMEKTERTFFLATFSSILRAVSNADDQTQKTYVSGTLTKMPPSVRPSFERKLWRAIDSVEETAQVRQRGTGEIICGSATKIPLEPGSVDLIVTSPPYLDSVDYPYNLMLEYFWLGSEIGVGSRAEFNQARTLGIGSKQPANGGIRLPDELEGLIDFSNVPQYRQAVVAPYFRGMADHFAEAARVLKPDGRYVLVVGNSRTQAGMIPLHDALVALAATAGMHMDHAFGYRIRRHYMKFPRKGRGGIILMDWVITLCKQEDFSPPIRRLPLIDDQLPPDSVAN